MSVNFKIDNHIIMPFGCKKWDIKQVKLASVSANATYFSSSTSCAYIDQSSTEPLRLVQFKKYFPKEESSYPRIFDPKEALCYIREFLKSNCMVETTAERKFLDLYFQFIYESASAYVKVNDWYFEWWQEHHYELLNSGFMSKIDHLMQFFSLMPFPQAHIYANNPLTSENDSHPNRMMRVDFAFWTGKNLVAVEIDGSSHIGNRRHVEKDRLLARSGVYVIHILNEELDEYGTEVIKKLMPLEIVNIPYLDLIKKMGLYKVYVEAREEPFNELFNPLCSQRD